jgi:hypothetical protein
LLHVCGIKTITFFVTRDSPFSDPSAWVQNEGAACTTASLLIALGLLKVPSLPALGPTTLALGAAHEYGAPGLLDYVSGRLDRRVEALAAERGVAVRSRTGLVLPGWPLRPRPDQVLVAHLAWGQERPGVYGTWGFSPLRPATWWTGGHSVVVLESVAGGGWRVLDPNHPGIQDWPRRGVAVTATQLHRTPSPPGRVGVGAPP